VYPEDTLVGRLQSGQLDAGFFYAAEARAAGIPTVPLTGRTFAASYTITVLRAAPHEAAAEAFVEYLLGPGARPLLNADGFVLTAPPPVSGTGVPASLQGVLSGR
jgi:molybdate/tungstate transport system substrate-binding protein